MAVDDSYTKSLLHMDGADASPTFTDESGKTWTAFGNAQIDTAQFVFGGAAGLFDGTGDYATTPNNSDFDFGTNNFTVDCRVRRNGNNTNDNGIVSSHYYDGTSHGWGLGFNNANKIRFTFDGPAKVTSTTTLSDLTWYHVAVVRSGDTLALYINGVSEATTSVAGVSYGSGGNGVVIGRWSVTENNYYINGHIDEVRISKGIARWTANFTPPTSAYAPSAAAHQVIIMQ